MIRLALRSDRFLTVAVDVGTHTNPEKLRHKKPPKEENDFSLFWKMFSCASYAFLWLSVRNTFGIKM
jgi:hypothetical protein